MARSYEVLGWRMVGFGKSKAVEERETCPLTVPNLLNSGDQCGEKCFCAFLQQSTVYFSQWGAREGEWISVYPARPWTMPSPVSPFPTRGTDECDLCLKGHSITI
jgi:hypothetical protein